jgi:hypothetical protein
MDTAQHAVFDAGTIKSLRAVGAFLGLEYAAFEGGQIDKTL